MEVQETKIKGVVVCSPKIYHDDRGQFSEGFHTEKYEEIIGKGIVFVQDNISISKKNVIRGLHFQAPPKAQGKLVQVLKGRILDVVVDLRKKSKTYGEYISIELSDKNNKQIWIPAGFAHGFISKEDGTILNYKCTSHYDHTTEQTIRWDDSNINIDWQTQAPILSKKDMEGVLFKNFKSPF
tara:strand:- start:859 stop:1404 length:546 start_codon:yes stop_codon:yes gene_type:complete